MKILDRIMNWASEPFAGDWRIILVASTFGTLIGTIVGMVVYIFIATLQL